MILCVFALKLGLSLDVCTPLPSGGSIEYWVNECRHGVQKMPQISYDGRLRNWYSCNGHTWWTLQPLPKPNKYKYDPADRDQK